jgi:glycosyltransferase involved in cell wall biosynthesis
MGRPVGVLPFVHHATTRLRSRVGARPCTVSVIGHQRVEKGYGLMPDVVRILQASGEDIRLLIHNGDPREMADAQQAVRKLAATDARIRLDERVADPAIWSELLDASDLIVCPYEPSRYALSASAVASEAIANAIPVVVPGHTALSRLVREFGGPGTTFEGFDAVSVAAGVLEALRNFDQLAELAYLAAGRWAERFGPDRLVEAILAVGDPGAVNGTLSSAYPSAISVE